MTEPTPKKEDSPKTGESWVCQKFKAVCKAGKSGAEIRAELEKNNAANPNGPTAAILKVTNPNRVRQAELDATM